jgi:hypothetical protein
MGAITPSQICNLAAFLTLLVLQLRDDPITMILETSQLGSSVDCHAKLPEALDK